MFVCRFARRALNSADMNLIRYFLVGAVGLVTMAVSAQWAWTDRDGRKVYSDRAPPLNVPEKNILKRPGGRSTTMSASNFEVTAPASVTAASAPLGTASAPRSGGIDKELNDKKKKAEEAELAKRKIEEERVLKAKVENCARAKQARATLDSGMRIARTNDKGEREIMDDAARATERSHIQSIIDSDCQ